MPSAATELEQLRDQFNDRRDPERAASMEAYMQDKFEFVGMAAPARKQLAGPLLNATRGLTGDELCELAAQLWAEPYREFHYVACDLMQRRATALQPQHLDEIERLIRTQSWWDTVDTLATNVVGNLVKRYPDLVATMDVWIDDDNLWIARSAILHQLKFGQQTDEDRLFHYAIKRAGDTEFFIRKSIGWSLRQYAKTSPDAVVAFVEEHADVLSGLTRREALKHLSSID